MGPQRPATQQEQPKKKPKKSHMTEGFGLVTEEDRARWEQTRARKAQERKETSIGTNGIVGAFGGMADIMGEGVRAKLYATQGAEIERESASEVEQKRQRMVDDIVKPSYEKNDQQRQAGDEGLKF